MLRLLGGARFQALFHSPPGVLFTFPSRYWSAIGRRRVFSLGGWSPQLRAGFHVARATQGRARGRGGFAYGALTRCGRPSHAVPLPPRFVTSPGPRRPPWRALQPRRGKAAALSPSPVWASARFRSPLLPGSRLISPPPGTEMFQFPGLPPPSLCVQLGVPGHDPWRVPPFGHPRIEGRLRLPGAYRRLPRPSSASCAKASAVRP